MAIIVEIPTEFARSFGATDEEAARNAKIELAIEMYREGKWSTGRAAEFAGLGLIPFMNLLRERRVPKPYSKEMLEEDLAHGRDSF